MLAALSPAEAMETVPMLTSVSARARGKVSRSGMESGLRFRCWWAAGWKTVSDARCDWLASMLAVLSPAEAMGAVLMLTSASAWARSKVPEVAVGRRTASSVTDQVSSPVLGV